MSQASLNAECRPLAERVPEVGDIDVDGQAVHYVAGGAGPALIFLHNGGVSHRVWDAQLSYFARSHRVFALDLLGYGASSKPEIDYTLPVYVRMLGAFLDAHRISSATLVGNCLGSATALGYALENPGRVAALVLCNTLTEQTLLQGEFGSLYRLVSHHPHLRRSLERIERHLILPRWAQELSFRSLFPRGTTPPPELLAHLRRLNDDPAQMRVLGNLLFNLHSFSVLDQVTKPRDFPFVCSIWGRENRVLRVEGGQSFCAGFRPDRAIVLDACGHLLMVDRPDRVVDLIHEAIAASRLPKPLP